MRKSGRAGRWAAAMLLMSPLVATAQSGLGAAPPRDGPATSAPAVPASAPSESAEKATPAAPPRGPQYMALRFNDDFSYLDGPTGSFAPDWFDPIKNIHLNDDWRLLLGGELRERMESETNRTFGARDPGQDTFLLQRLTLHADLKYRKLFRVFLEGIDAPAFDKDLPLAPNQENRFDLSQAFFDFRPAGENVPLTLRGGRQELSYGRQRVLGKLDWVQSTRRFDGVKLMWQSPLIDVDVFWTKPVLQVPEQFRPPLGPRIDEGLNRKPDHFREQQQFYGLYSTFKGIKNHVVDVYFLGLNDENDDFEYFSPNGQTGRFETYTYGARFAGTTWNFDYDVEAAGQFGHAAGDPIRGAMVGADAGYTFKELPTTPRFGLGFDFATGDDTPRDGSIETFNQLYPTAHAPLGYLDLVGRQNIISPNVNFSFKPVKNVTVTALYYHFWLASDQDALYNVAGIGSRRDVSGSAGRDVGDELDLTVNWQIDPHSSLLIGASHFWPDGFINHSGRSEDADLLYVQWVFKF